MKKTLDVLEKGDYFGEIAIMTKLKRTCTVKSYGEDFCILSSFSQEALERMKIEFPQIYLNYKNELVLYDDDDTI